MLRAIDLLGLGLFVVLALRAQQGAGTPASLPPLIDREIFFGNPEITAAQISPDGRFIAFLKPWKDTRNIWVKKTGDPFTSARLLTAEVKRPIPTYAWTRDGKYILYVKDNDGDENFNVFAVDPASPAPDGHDAPPSRDLTGLKGVQVAFYSLPKKDPDVAYIGLNDRDKAWHDLYRLKISTGEKTLLRKNTERIASWIFDLDGRLRMAFRTTDSGDQEILRVDPDGFAKVYSCGVFENCSPIRFDKEGRRVYIETNKGDSNDLSALVLLDPQNGKTEIVEADPLKRVDFGEAIFSELTDQLVMTTYVDDKTRRYFHDKKLESDYKWLQSKLPGKELHITSTSKDEVLFLISAASDTEPGETFLFDRKARTLTPQYKIREKLPREALASMKAIRYPSSDGLEIPGYLTLPKGLPETNLPVIALPHGGPWGRDVWGYNSLAQFLANRGYAVFMPNFRGSTGYGKQFLNAGNGEWGRKMQDDVTWGVKYLIAQGMADPKRIGIMGGSYGGYATLAGVAFTPDVYRAAVDIVGPSNLITLLDSIPPYWESFRKIMFARMADPGTAQGKAWLKERSPLTAADKIRTPLMVVQGANDPRVNRAEAEQIVIALRDRGFPIEYLLADDEGHGFQRPVNNMALFMASEKFLAKYLDGRYQEGGKPEVVSRLKEITVDPKTVKLSKKVDTASVGVPKPVAALHSDTYHYDVKLAMGGQETAMKMSTVIKEENGGWTATDTVETPMGAMTDSTSLDKSTLIVRKRDINQGPAVIHLDFNDNKAAGSVRMNGKETPVSVELGGAIFADGPGALQVIATLPLAEGYSATYRNFDVQKQKLKLMQLKVTGSEKVTVAAGSFETYQVDLESADGGPEKATVWIAKDTRKPVKLSTVLPGMGGAKMVAELKE
jgi:dipeptidyl aminopeptidase/acylaminoacyl peptidase